MVTKSLQASIVKKFTPSRKYNSRKGDNGTVLVVGGSTIYHGAPILSSIAALRSGTDLVYTAVPKTNVAPTRAISPNLIVIPMADQKLTRGTVNKLLGTIPKNLDSATIGMGLAVQDREALKLLVKSLIDRDVRLSLDASALVPEILPLLPNTNSVVTPHAGEFKRLFGELPSNTKKPRVSIVEKYAKQNNTTILLKGAIDVISNGKTTFVNEMKTPAMTVGGTGDVLSGLVAGMLAKNRNSVEAASCATFFNGMAGKSAQKKLGLHITAMDLLDEIPLVMKPFDKLV